MQDLTSWTHTLEQLGLADPGEVFWLSNDPDYDDEALAHRTHCL